MMVHVFRYLKLLGAFAFLWAGLFVFNNYGCRKPEGSEMDPTIKRDESRLTAPKVRTPDQLHHDDLVSYTYFQPGKSQRNMVGRVVGLPGDKLRMEKGEVFRNNSKIAAGFVEAKQRSDDGFAEIVVPRDTVFVMGDNRRAAREFDSRTIGPLARWAINARIR
jgi:signal peptidase I